MELIYKTVITAIGKNAEDFINHEMFIIFKENVPKELEDYCYMHLENNLSRDILPEDILFIDQYSYKIIGVGSAVNQNLKELGHITFKFTGEVEGNIPGTLFLEKKEIVPIKNGTSIEIKRFK